ncbi:MAG: recombinase family protein [Thermoleophilaceae bacterium]
MSTDEVTQPYSLEAQNDRLAAYAASQDGWQITRRFSDQMTGATLERPGLQRALAEAKTKRFTCCWSTASTGYRARCAAWRRSSKPSTTPRFSSARRPGRSTPPRRRGG